MADQRANAGADDRLYDGGENDPHLRRLDIRFRGQMLVRAFKSGHAFSGVGFSVHIVHLALLRPVCEV